MNELLSLLARGGDLALVLLGFSLIIVIHELGHFVAARWAGIRVLAFAVGFGPALMSYRRGLGWRRGSSEAAYKKLAGEGAGEVSATEYRLNMLPFGGYVKMLGQDDLDATARSEEPDSYQSCKPWKRMIVISAGVVANVITAAVLFIAVFMMGLRTEPAKVGAVEPGSPAATAVATNAAELGVTAQGLRSGDEIVAIDGDKPLSFNDLVLASAMARRGATLNIEVKREGVAGLLRFPVLPTEDRTTRMLYIGVLPAASNKVISSRRADEVARFREMMEERGLHGLEAGMTLTAVNGAPAKSAYDLSRAADASGGKPLVATMTKEGGGTVEVPVPTRPRLMRDRFMVEANEATEARHLLGLMPVLAVEDVPRGEGGERAGLKPGDVFVRIGSVEWPSIPSGKAEIRSHRGKTVRLVVARRDGEGARAAWKEHDLGEVRVSSAGTIGFNLGDSGALGSWVGSAFAKVGPGAGGMGAPKLPAGSRITELNGKPVSTLLDLREQLRAASEGLGGTTVTLTVESPIVRSDGTRAAERVEWALSESDARSLASAPWETALETGLFDPERIVLQATGPLDAIRMGVRETRRVMMTTYVTLARLFQGTIKVSHLKGPVGIAHVGTLLADRGFTWLLFFMALISVNLAVLNFLPLPIVDGGHFVFLVYEQVTGKPVSVAVQNIASIAGLIVIAALFLIVTYHDITNLFKG